MSIQQIAMFVTRDGEAFPTLEAAEAHDAALEIESRINRYLAQIHGTDKAASRAAAAVRRFLLWEAGQQPETEPCHEP
jgi:hypothetical protein